MNNPAAQVWRQMRNLLFRADDSCCCVMHAYCCADMCCAQVHLISLQVLHWNCHRQHGCKKDACLPVAFVGQGSADLENSAGRHLYEPPLPLLVAELHNIIYQLNTLFRISKQGTNNWQSRIHGQQRGSSFMWDTLNGNMTWMWASTEQSIAWQARAHFTV
jgi:hypothetical protein